MTELVGCETPRIWSKPLRELTPETSDGFSVIEFAEDILEIELMPWQKWLFIHALELAEDGRQYRFRTVLLLVARQNGKTACMIILALWHIYLRGSRTVIGTAQDLKNSEKAWAEALEMAQANEELAVEIANVNMQVGKKSMKLETNEEYQVAAASRRGARGFSGDLILMDELREHQNWDSWAAAAHTTIARPEAQVWAFSNAGDALSIVLRYLRAVAHRGLGWPDGDDDAPIIEASAADLDDEDLNDDSLGIFEWSAQPSAQRNDRQAWAQANPALGHTITDRAIAAAMVADPPHTFLTEVLCRWITSAEAGPFPAGAWMGCRDNSSTIDPAAQRVIGIDVSWDRSMSYVALAGQREDGVPHGEITAARTGTDWVIGWAADRVDKIAGCVVQTNGAPASSLIDGLKAAGIPVIDWAGADLGRATGQAYDALVNGRVRHLQHPGLDLAANSAAVKAAGEAWIIDRRKSPNDAAPLIAWVGAIWGLTQLKPVFRSAYEDNDLMVV